MLPAAVSPHPAATPLTSAHQQSPGQLKVGVRAELPIRRCRGAANICPPGCWPPFCAAHGVAQAAAFAGRPVARATRAGINPVVTGQAACNAQGKQKQRIKKCTKRMDAGESGKRQARLKSDMGKTNCLTCTAEHISDV